MIVLTHTPSARAAKKGHVALVGKGVTYDTGGLSLKISGSMVGMKTDMGGAAAVLGAFRALVKGGAPCKVSAVICLAENAIGPAAYKPDDVIQMHSGYHVEINNTDAEGRLVLGDALSYASQNLNPLCMLDFATLTGACIIALGHEAAAVMSPSEELYGRIEAASQRSLDRVSLPRSGSRS